MYVSVSRLRVPAHASEELIAAFRRRAHLVDDAYGFVDLQVSESARDAVRAGGPVELSASLSHSEGDR